MERDKLNLLLMLIKEAGGYVWPKMKEHIIELEAAFLKELLLNELNLAYAYA